MWQGACTSATPWYVCATGRAVTRLFSLSRLQPVLPVLIAMSAAACAAMTLHIKHPVLLLYRTITANATTMHVLKHVHVCGAVAACCNGCS